MKYINKLVPTNSISKEKSRYSTLDAIGQLEADLPETSHDDQWIYLEELVEEREGRVHVIASGDVLSNTVATLLNKECSSNHKVFGLDCEFRNRVPFPRLLELRPDLARVSQRERNEHNQLCESVSLEVMVVSVSSLSSHTFIWLKRAKARQFHHSLADFFHRNSDGIFTGIGIQGDLEKMDADRVIDIRRIRRAVDLRCIYRRYVLTEQDPRCSLDYILRGVCYPATKLPASNEEDLKDGWIRFSQFISSGKGRKEAREIYFRWDAIQRKGSTERSYVFLDGAASLALGVNLFCYFEFDADRFPKVSELWEAYHNFLECFRVSTWSENPCFERECFTKDVRADRNMRCKYNYIYNLLGI